VLETVDEDLQLLTQWTDRFTFADEGIHRHHRTVWDDVDKLYHGYRGLKAARKTTGPNDRYPLLRDARAEFGHELFIPYAFSIVETVLPRLLSNRPRMLVLPRTSASEKNVENMRALIDEQQNRINYELKVQSAAKSGLMYGLGVQKTFWRTKKAEKDMPVPANWALRAMGKPYALEKQTEVICDDPQAEAVNIRDFFWDPYATSIDTARWLIHRLWPDTAYVRQMLETGAWDNAELTDEDLDSGGAASQYNTAHAGQRDAQNMPNPNARDTDVHELWECHDRNTVVTILDRKWIVKVRANESYPGRHIFQAYRPTEIPNQLVGKGEIEPIRDLQYEMNMLRTHRRWNAEVAMHRVFFYSDGLIDPKRFKIAPGALIPVSGDPNEVLKELQMGDVPHSSYREAQEIAADIERTSGISDSTSGADAGAAQTATGIQLVQAAANARIQLKTRRVEVELIREGCRHWGAMNQRYILERREVQVPAPPTPEEPDRMAVWLDLGPKQLAGEFDYEPEGGSTTPENIPQKRQDFQFALQLMAQPGVDTRRILVWAMEQLGLKHPETYLAPDVHVPPETLNMIAAALIQAGMDQGQVEQIVGGALNAALDAEQQQAPGGAQLPAEPGP
jgi:hypothetical protein